MRLRRQAHAVRGSEQCPAAGLEQAGRFAEHGHGISHMLDDVAAVDRPESVVHEGHRFALATDEVRVAKAGLVKPLASQHQPPHGDIHSDEAIRRKHVGKSDQTAAGPATQVENMRSGGLIFREPLERLRPRPLKNMPHLPANVGRAKFRAMPQVISLEQLRECQISGGLVQVGGHFVVTIVTAVRVVRRPQIGNSAQAAIFGPAGTCL